MAAGLVLACLWGCGLSPEQEARGGGLEGETLTLEGRAVNADGLPAASVHRRIADLVGGAGPGLIRGGRIPAYHGLGIEIVARGRDRFDEIMKSSFQPHSPPISKVFRSRKAVRNPRDSRLYRYRRACATH